MRILKAATGEKFSSLTEALAFPKKKRICVSFVGAGGKTTLIFQLAKEFVSLGKRVIVTTTTHMKEPETGFIPWQNEETFERIKKYLETEPVVSVGVPCLHHGIKKIKGLETEQCQKLQTYADILLVEADGSRGMPVKIPAAHEPVVPDFTDVTIAVLGYPALGNSLERCAYRPEELARFLGKEITDVLEIKDIKTIWERKEGARRGMKGECRFVLCQCPGDCMESIAENWREESEIYLCEKEESL